MSSSRARSTTEQYASKRLEADPARLKSRLRPMRGLKRDHSARVIMRGHALMQNIRRGHYELAVETRPCRRVAGAFSELAGTICTDIVRTGSCAGRSDSMQQCRLASGSATPRPGGRACRLKVDLSQTSGMRLTTRSIRHPGPVTHRGLTRYFDHGSKMAASSGGCTTWRCGSLEQTSTARAAGARAIVNGQVAKSLCGRRTQCNRFRNC